MLEQAKVNTELLWNLEYYVDHDFGRLWSKVEIHTYLEAGFNYIDP